ncbi:MAG: hypothetical protein RJA81_2238, partial [Planctomycetota bacterium]
LHESVVIGRTGWLPGFRQRTWLSGFLIPVVLTGCSLLISGCGTSENESANEAALRDQSAVNPTFEGVKLRVAAMQDPALGQVTGDMVGEWQASRKAEVEIATPAETDVAGQLDPSVDVWLIRGEKLGELIDRDLVEPLDNLNADWQKRPPVFDGTICRYGPERYAVPVGTSMLVMVYRQDVEKQPDWQQAMKDAAVDFPPKTWDDFDKLLVELKKKNPKILALPDLPQNNERLLLDLFLARSTATGKHRDHFSFLFSAETMEPRIAGAPFVDSLTAIAAMGQPTGLTPDEARKAFRQGDYPILIDYAEKAALWADASEKNKIAVAPLPGSFRVYEPDRKAYDRMQTLQNSSYIPNGGGYLAVIAKGRSETVLKAARDFLIYLTGESTAVQWAADRRMPMCPTRDSLLVAGFVDPRMAPKVEGGAWGEAILDQLASENPVVGLRIPQADLFLEELQAALFSSVKGGDPKAELAKVADQWNKRVNQFGRERLKWHYRRSLIRPLTDATPPPAGK